MATNDDKESSIIFLKVITGRLPLPRDLETLNLSFIFDSRLLVVASLSGLFQGEGKSDLFPLSVKFPFEGKKGSVVVDLLCGCLERNAWSFKEEVSESDEEKQGSGFGNQYTIIGTSLMYDGEYHFRSSASVAISSQKSGQKRTRQWAAWTRQEQENFFSALRQVGKNFEKITSRVQSKNKNQVRHYYYRLVRRMNKLLSPGFCLDAKNSKDTNAAMLRWWSLLEKYSCTPSKLYRKPRRFKIFIEALENQLLKDRNKAKRKRPCQGENYLETSSTTSLVRRFSEDVCAVKAVFLIL
ncbi:hypothetical protein HPP92_011997 [Vanilla planifolia]|uniref:SANT domain-containing protein n=1 Tax=Vanilla planifolia TaxID=51239 RepID=A0A835R586_VANPL|nr:hypothetical protein HPP92_011997 [Vanilla planifolia]